MLKQVFFFSSAIEDWMPLSTATTTTTNIQIRTISGAQYQVDWGDGTITTHNSDTVANKTYSSPYAGVIKVRAVSGGLINIDKLQITAGNWNFDISVLKYYVPNLTYLWLVSNTSTWSGDIANVPSGLTALRLISDTSTWSGDIANIPSGLTTLRLESNLSTWSGDIANVPSGVTTLYLISNISTWSGDIANVPSGVTTLYLISNLSTWSGDIANVPSGLTLLRLESDTSTWTGDISNAPTGLTYLRLLSNLSTWTYTSGRVWKNVTILYLRPKVSTITSTMVDNLFIDLDSSPLVTGAGTIDLRGNCGAVTSASLAARNSLVTKGKTLLFN